MPAGDLITGIYQWELEGFLFGSGTGIDLMSVKGYGPIVRAARTARSHSAGSTVGWDTDGDLELEFEMEIWQPGNPDAAGDQLAAAMAAFAAHDADLNLVELHGWLPGDLGRHKLLGRPAGLDFVLTESITRGYQPMTGRFVATEPVLVAVTEPGP